MRVSIDERLARLCADFSVVKIDEWLERKFASYDTSKADVISIAENKNDKEYFKGARLLGYVRDLPDGRSGAGNRPLLVAAVEMRKILTERTSRQAQFNFAKRVLQNAVRSGAAGLNGYPSQGLFFFYDNEQFFRISLVSGEMEGRKFKFNEAKRQSFYINPDRPNNIAKSRLSESIETYADLKKAFSVETLTKEFYGKLFEWYEWAMKPRTGVTFPNDDSTPDDDKRYNNESIIRLITRLMFTWFIRQRDMVRAELFTVEGVKALLKNFDSKSMEDDNYYRCILQNLFFATFNCQPEKRKFIQRSFHGRSDGFGVKTLYRYEKEFKDAAAFKELVKKTPFLNCALFDCLDRQQRESEGGKILLFDGFSDTRKRQAHVPNGLFFHPEKGIIPLFDTYEFTIDENNADDADVALDPELLGKVFENLLGAFNPETQETARKATGSFYTPREIVDYMVEESLKNHIKTKVPRIKDAWLAELFDKTAAAEKRELPFDDEIAAEIRESLYSCKILDPACGSGAFPMGILHCMVRLFGRLDPANYDLNKRLIARYKQETNLPPDPLETAAEREERLEALKLQLDEGQHYPDYARKLYLIENCIYGVDIQPIATQISKLRFFISLLCDQLRENWNAESENHGLLSLPNLEAKFVCANTLISLPKTEGELELMSCSKIPKLREKLQENRHRIFAARTFKQKEKLKARDLEIRDEIREAVRSTLAKPDKELIKVQEEVIAKLRKDRIPFETPKMVREQKAVQGDFFAATQANLGFEMVDANKPKRDQIDAQIEFAQRKIDSELAKSSTANVTKIDQLASLVAGWDPYDQNASSSFFDPEWMFNLLGFDVVIGNPPYGAKISELEARYFKSNYPVARTIPGRQKGSTDTFAIFINRGYDVLVHNGVLSYIVPMSITSSEAMSGVHNLLFDNCEDVTISSYSNRPRQMFESAGLRCSIISFWRTDSAIKRLMTTKMMRRRYDDEIESLIKNLQFENTYDLRMFGRLPKAGSVAEVSVLRKMFKNRQVLDFEKSGGKKIYYRAAGGRYWNVVTNYSTHTSAEKYLSTRYTPQICACLSSSLFWFYQQVYTDGLNLKVYEIEHFPVPDFENVDNRVLDKLENIYLRYLKDIERNANQRDASGSSSYNVDSFKEYKIGYSKKIIDEIDDFIGPLYGLTKDEVEFIKNYEIEFRMADYMTPEEIAELQGRNAPAATSSRRHTARPAIAADSPRAEDDEKLE